jgi:glutathione S-transferase
MKFYMTPGSCSTGIHILLEELELAFEVYLVNLMAGDQFKPDYLAINPKSTIPTLVKNDGVAITDFQAIAWWLARSYPKAKLIPDTLDDEVRVLELMNYIVGTLHGQGYTRIFTTANYSSNETEHAQIEKRGYDIVEKAFAVINDQLSEAHEYAFGAFSIADVALFYVEFWADKLKLTLPTNCLAHYQRMLTRPAVRRVLLEEGYRV